MYTRVAAAATFRRHGKQHQFRKDHSTIKTTTSSRNSQQLVVEVDARGQAGGRDEPAEVERKNPDNAQELFVHWRERHLGDLRKLEFEFSVDTVDPTMPPTWEGRDDDDDHKRKRQRDRGGKRDSKTRGGEAAAESVNT